MQGQQEKEKTILLVEDEAVIAMTEEQTLKRHGFNVIVAPSGEKAVNIVKNTPNIDLILMDINLGKGKMDGTEAAEIILKDNDIPVLFLSSYTQAEVVQKTEQITSYGYVVKDSGETVLITSIKMAFKLFDAHQRLKKREEALRGSEERYRTLVNNASDIVFKVDDTGYLTFVNPAALRVMGYGEKELIGKHYATLIRPDMCDEAMKFFGRQFVKKIENTYSEYPVVVKDGREIWLGQNTQLIFQDGKVVAFQAMARDITERKRMEKELSESERRYRDLSIIDDLTQLYNSRYFYHQLKLEIDRVDRYEEKTMTLLLLDLDDFKQFNDAYGHVEGDQVLSRLGQVVKRCLRQTDSAYRYGGEEFTIILPMTTSKDAVITAERIRREFKKDTFSPAPAEGDVHVTVSIGLGQYKPQEDMKAFVIRVDQLMYQAKKNGKDCVYLPFDSSR